MFSKKDPVIKMLSILSSDIEVTGDIKTSSPIRIEGKVHGNITSTSNIALSKEGYVKGNIESKDIKISGKVIGDLNIDGKLWLTEKGIINGNIQATVLQIEIGGEITGAVEMKKDKNLNTIKNSISENKVKSISKKNIS